MPEASKIIDRLTSITDYPPVLEASKKLPIDQWRKTMAAMCRHDLYFLVRYGLGLSKAENDWIFARCREVQANPDWHLDLWAREHWKSSIITAALTIQDILRDSETTVGIFSHSRDIAKSFLRRIKREFETNTMLKACFPDVLYADPKKESPKWSEDEGIIVKRKGNPPESTIEAWGLVDGMPTGRHFKLRVYDDVVTRESVTTPDQIAKTTEAWELSDSLGQEGGKARYIGTRYHLADTYKVIMERKVATPRIHTATHNGRIDGSPVLFTSEEWDRRKKTNSRATLASQYMQNPLADEDATFQPEWLRPYEVRPRTLRVYIMCDPSRGRSAESDNTAIAVVGVSSSNLRYLLDGYRHRMTLSQRWTALRDLHRHWSRMPGVVTVDVGYERYGAQSDDEYFQERMRAEKYNFPMTELNWTRDGTKSKRERVERLEPDFRNGRFLLPLAVWRDGKPCVWKVDDDPESKSYRSIQWSEVEGFTRIQEQHIEAGAADLVAKAIKRINEEGRVYDLTEKFIEEFLTFPFGEYKDLVDATSRLYDMEPVAPKIVRREDTEPQQFADS